MIFIILSRGSFSLNLCLDLRFFCKDVKLAKDDLKITSDSYQLYASLYEITNPKTLLKSGPVFISIFILNPLPLFPLQANQREEEYKNQIKMLNNRLKEVFLVVLTLTCSWGNIQWHRLSPSSMFSHPTCSYQAQNRCNWRPPVLLQIFHKRLTLCGDPPVY